MLDDPLVPGPWPNTACEFFFEKPPDAPRGMTLTVDFDATKYHGLERERALEDAATYEDIAQQLKSAGACVTLQSSIDMRKAHELDPSVFATFAADVSAYLRAFAEGATHAPPAALSIHAAMEPENTYDIFFLNATVTISQSTLNCSPRPAPEFARAFEAAYADAESFFKVLCEGTEDAKSGTWTPWAMRLRQPGTPAGPGVTFAIDGPARYYAPVPLAKIPLSRGNVPIFRYDPASGIDWDDPISTTFTGVDLDRWAQTAFAAIDRFGEIAFDGARSEHFVRLSQIKADLAARVSSTVAPICKTADALPEAARENAAKTLRQQMFDKSESAYAITAICQFEAAVSSRYDDNPAQFVYAPRFLGTLRSEPPCTFSMASAVLAPGKAFVGSALTLEAPQAQSHLPLDLVYDIERVLYPAARRDLWFVIPFDSARESAPKTAIGAVDVPIVLRAMLAPPMLRSQDAAPAEDHAAGLAAALRWNYAVSYNASMAAQDAIDFCVSFNNAQESPDVDASSVSARGDLDLFDHLARIVAVVPLMLQEPKRALADFVRLLEPLPQAWTAWQAPPQAPQPARGEFSLREHDKDGFLVLTRTHDPNAASLPEPSIQIIADAITYTARPSSVPGEFYYADESGKRLTSEAGRNLAERRVVFTGLPIASFQNASSAIQITRNGNFAPEFEYSSLSRFTGNATPHLSSGERFDVSLLSSPRQQTLATHLQRLLATLYEGTAKEATESFSISAAYAQRVCGDGPDFPVPIAAGGRVTVDYERAIEVANESAAVILKWFAEHRPSAGCFRFELTLFETLGEDRTPLLTLTGLEVQSGDVADLPSVMA